MKTKSIFLLFLSILIVSCTGSHRRGTEQGDTLKLKYAEHLNLVKYDGYTVATLVDPWKKGRTLHTYVLVPREGELPEKLPQGTVIRTPIRSSVVFTSVHCSLFMMLGAQNAIKGVCDLGYINLPWIRKMAAIGRIADCGNSMQADVERIIDIKPDVLLVSPFENSGGYGRLEEVNIPIVECADYMETSALGRAEWMKFYGLLTGREQQADSLFAVVDANYKALKAEAAKSKVSRSVITERKMGAVWYVPGGQSVPGRLLKDAGARYAFADVKQSGSLSLPFETVLDKAGEADVWLYKYNDHPANYKELSAEFEGYTRMKAFKMKQIYGCNTSRIPYFEEAPFRPDYLLRDIIHIVHPDLKPVKLRYYSLLP